MPRLSWNSNDLAVNVEENHQGVACALQRMRFWEDCWITSTGAYLRSSSATRDIRMLMYVNGKLEAESPSRRITDSYALRQYNTVVRVPALTDFHFGFGLFGTGGSGPIFSQLNASSKPPDDPQSQINQADGASRFALKDTKNDPSPASVSGLNSDFLSFSTSDQRMKFRGHLDYVKNAPPTKPVISSPANGAQITGLSINVTASLPHNGGDGDLDYTQTFQLRVYEADGTVVYDQVLTPTTTERDNNAFTREVTNLRQAKQYYVQVRHTDSWGVVSDYSTTHGFQTLSSPDPPELVAPLVKLDARSNFEYRMRHSHPVGVAAKAVQLELYNASGSTLLWSSGTVTLGTPAQSGETFNVLASSTLGTQPQGATGHPTLLWATAYSWRERVQDTNNVWSPWSARGSFRTNATPTAPTNLVPADKAVSGVRTLSASVSDPDGDPVTAAQVELVRVSTGAVVTGYPKNMTITNSGATATLTAASEDLVQGAQYRFRVRATDGLASGYGPYSGYSTFYYAVSPEVTLLTPRTRTNLIMEPSAEYEPDDTDPFWTVVNPDTTGQNSIVREESDDTYFGRYRWVGTRQNTSVPAPYMQSKKMPVAELERYLVQMMMKHIPVNPSDVSAANETLPYLASLLQVFYYSASGQEIGGSTPNSIRITGGDPEDFWTRYGGAIWPSDETSSPRFTSGTTHAAVRITPVWDRTGKVAFDAIMFEEMPDATAGEYAGQHYADSSFFGYADPQTDGYGGIPGEWTAGEGNSPQRIGGVLVDATENHVMYSFSHPSNFALNATRVVVQRWDVKLGAWRAAYDSGFLAPAATPTVTLPDFLFENETRYRAQVICRDSAGVLGYSPFSEFVVRYPGPPELPIYSYSADPARGTITIQFESTSLEEGVFEGIQIARASHDEPQKIVAVIRNPGAYEYTYHYPLSGKDYRFSVRQLSSVGPERLEGRWTRINASVEYPALNFLKNAHDPRELVAFAHESGAGPNIGRGAQAAGYIPWGSFDSVHLFSEARLRADTTTFALYPPDTYLRSTGSEGSAFAGTNQSESERIGILKKWDAERPPVALLLAQPEPEKLFIALTGDIKMQRRGKYVYCELNWESTSFAEPSPDELEGIVERLRLLDLNTSNATSGAAGGIR